MRIDRTHLFTVPQPLRGLSCKRPNHNSPNLRNITQCVNNAHRYVGTRPNHHTCVRICHAGTLCGALRAHGGRCSRDRKHKRPHPSVGGAISSSGVSYTLNLKSTTSRCKVTLSLTPSNGVLSNENVRLLKLRALRLRWLARAICGKDRQDSSGDRPGCGHAEVRHAGLWFRPSGRAA